jgi:hypothetical protein
LFYGADVDPAFLMIGIRRVCNEKGYLLCR